MKKIHFYEFILGKQSWIWVKVYTIMFLFISGNKNASGPHSWSSNMPSLSGLVTVPPPRNPLSTGTSHGFRSLFKGHLTHDSF
jgi:hypothetical protein